MSRIPLLDPKNFNETQAEFYKNNTGGKLNIYRLLCLAPTCQPGYGMLANAIFATLDIPPVERELVVLAVAKLEDCAYEWAQHAQIALSMGITQHQIDAIFSGDFTSSVFNSREKILFEFTRQTVKSVRVDDTTFEALAAFFTSRQIVELLFTIGSYMMLGRIMEVAKLEVDNVLGADVVREAVRKHSDRQSA
jgi:4-carboxymuconolactone decarboxylase